MPDPSASYSTHTGIRSVGPPDAPFEGMLARAPDGTAVLLVDRNLLETWPAWRMPADDHVLAPLDVLRRPDGHDVVLPAVHDRLDRVIARRRAAGAPLTDGETLTAAVSVLRGMAAVHAERLQSTEASWWVSTEGKPLLVCGTGEESPERASTVIIDLLAQDATDESLRTVLGDIARGLASPREWVRALEGWEEALFAAAAPEPLMVEVLGPAPHRAVRSEDDDDQVSADDAQRSWWRPFARAVDAGWAESISDLLHRARRSARRTPVRRVRPVVWGVAAAGLVLTVGLSWPDPADPTAAAEAPGTETPAASPPSPSQATPTPPGGRPEEPLAALTALLTMRDGCPDAACRAGVNESAAEQLPGGAIDDPGRSIRLLDDFGGLAVLRVDAAGRPSQLVTIVTTAEGWRVRDVFDAADPPT